MDKEVVSFEVEILSTYISQDRLSNIMDKIEKAILNSLVDTDPDYAPVFVSVTNISEKHR